MHLLWCSTTEVAYLLALGGVLESLLCSSSCNLQPVQCVIQAVHKQLIAVIHVLQGLCCLCRGALQCGGSAGLTSMGYTFLQSRCIKQHSPAAGTAGS